MPSLSSFALALPTRSDCLLAHSGLRFPSNTYFMATSTRLIILREGPCNYTSFDEARLRRSRNEAMELIARSEPRPGVGHLSDARGNHDIVGGRPQHGQ